MLPIIDRMRNEPITQWTFGEWLLAICLAWGIIFGIIMTIVFALDQLLAATFTSVALIICAAAFAYIDSGEAHK